MFPMGYRRLNLALPLILLSFSNCGSIFRYFLSVLAFFFLLCPEGQSINLSLAVYKSNHNKYVIVNTGEKMQPTGVKHYNDRRALPRGLLLTEPIFWIKITVLTIIALFQTDRNLHLTEPRTNVTIGSVCYNGAV
jgi:hypothetical protein